MTKKQMEEKIEKMSLSIEIMVKALHVNNAINDNVDKRLDELLKLIVSHETRIKVLEESQ